ncbi:MAG: UvrD-helicase domain-containing protein [Spirochaetaceae bacterium]|nr:UvrD-helicase domain-containing protein [Spirochaetaceae bacterium]
MLLDELNEEQKLAVTATEGFVRVIAGAGSGKTRALTHRFAYLVNEVGILPSNILCVTFTNKAANEMRSRIRKLTGDNDTGYISTFHGFCVSILQEDSNAVQYPKSFLVLDNSDIDAMLQIIYEERGLTLRDMTFSNARDMIEIRKLFENPDYYNDMIRMTLDEIHQKYIEAKTPKDIIFYGYLYQEKKCFGLDYNDLLKFVLFIFEQNSEIKLKWQQRLEYIMIDEFQDIDLIQYQLMEVLCAYHKNLFIVGDPDQTIYTWRGANVKYLMDFDKTHEGTQTIMMMQNYRSVPGIINAANSLIAKNRVRLEKSLVPVRTGGALPKPVYYHAKSSEDEANYIADKIIELKTEGFAPADIVVMYRAHYISRVIEEVFQKKQIEYTLFSGMPFFDRAEIKDSLSYLRMIAYKDDLSFLRIVNAPKRNIGERRISFLKDYAEKNGCSLYEALKKSADDELFANTKAKAFIDLIEKYSASYAGMQISELFSHVMNESGYELSLRTEGGQERLDNLAELKQSIYEYETSCGEECTLPNYLAHAALYTNSDLGTTKDAVRFMTIHTAKGLEFPVVFLAGMNENMFPSKKVDSMQAMEEERRLCFVAYTRAKDRLYLTESEGTMQGFGYRYPSRFVFDVEKHLLDYAVEVPEHLVKNTLRYIEDTNAALAKISALSGLKKDDRISHAILGSGTIIDVDAVKHVYTVKFDSISTPRKMSFKAPLKKI